MPVVVTVRSLLRHRVVQIALMVVGLMAGWVASAGADLSPPKIALPTVTLPTITLPTITLPTVTTPTVTVPPLPPPPPLPPAPPPPTVPGVTLPSAHPPPPPGHGGGDGSSGGSGSQGSGGSSGAGSGGAGQSAGGTSSGREAVTGTSRVYRLRLARDWISRSGPRRHRRTTLVFVLRRPALVEFVVVQVSPACRRVGTFRVRGHRGVNRVRFDDRVAHHLLGPGTYRIVARRRGGKTVVDTRLVVVQNAKRANLQVARTANTCSPGTDLASVPATGTSASTGDPKGGGSTAAGPEKAHRSTSHRGVLGARFAKKAVAAARTVPLWLYGLVLLSILLLAAGAFLPKAAPRGLAASIVVGMTGAAVLLIATIAYALY